MKKIKFILILICLAIPFTFVGCQNKNKETLSTPLISEISGGTIVFDAVEHAEYYTISINDHNLIVDALHNKNVEIIDNQINFDASNIFIVGNSYAVKVKANSSKKIDSKFSASYSYRHSGNVEKPTNVKTNLTTLTWDVVENASYYLVKIITPNDTIIYDKQGNVLTEYDSESIARADLTEYSFTTNQFDFSSILNTAGTYTFYVNAVLSDAITQTESGYTSPAEYNHFVTLSTPKNGIVKQVGESLHITTVIDSNANAISITCNGYEKTAQLNGSEASIEKIGNNILDINLTSYFASIASSGNLNFKSLSQFAFKIKSVYLTNNPAGNFYLNSNYSDYALFENTKQISTPTLSIAYDNTNGCYAANWSCEDSALVSEYKLFVLTASGLKEYVVSSKTTNKLIFEDFIAIGVKAYGSGNHTSSQLSDFVSNPTLINTLPQIVSASLNNGYFANWSEIEDAYYLLELGDEIIITTENTYTITEKAESHLLKITAVKENYKHSSTSINLPHTHKLNTPTFAYNQGFNSKKLYELTFTGVDNAFGYYVYIKGESAYDFIKINRLYTSTTIDLTNYICSEGNYSDYQVKVQAVADPNGIYQSSDLSESVSVSHIQVLDIPKFYEVNQIPVPISKTVDNDVVTYTLKFFGVENAGSYEVLINYNKLTVPAILNYTGIYEIDVSKYLIAANNYEIKLKATPAPTSYNVVESSYNVANYALTKQLSMAENITVSENNGTYTLSFDPVDNAESYRVRIIKENDSSYLNYLNSIGLSNVIEVTQSVDVTNYVKQRGAYYFYITALAPRENSYYADAQESTTYGYINKLTTLNSPKNFEFTNISKDAYLLSWLGDDNADYYLIQIINPINLAYEFKIYGATSANINRYLTIPGTYSISVYSMVNPVGNNAKEYTSSSAGTDSLRYIYELDHDYSRYSIYMYGSYQDFSVTNVHELKTLLWYHYLYEIDMGTGLSIKLELQNNGNDVPESLREAILRYAVEANGTIHNFYEDEQWLQLLSTNTTSDSVLFSYLCEKLLEAYPEFGLIENFHIIDHASTSSNFTIYYKNSLNQEKIEDTQSEIFTNTNYGTSFEYIDSLSRRSDSGIFNIDLREEALVTTTEQLIQAVQHNRRPKFIGNSATAENIYKNAKLILSAIVTNQMSDYEKVTAIFEWLEATYDLTYYTIDGRSNLSGTVESEKIATYGLYKQYYLEGMFENITLLANGDLQVGSTIATSQSYSKAFALLCAIEGIDATVINGSYKYYNPALAQDTLVNHSWNKVYLSTSVDGSNKNWYVVDLTFADNRIFFNNLSRGYGISSHTFFLTSDTAHADSLRALTFPDQVADATKLTLKDNSSIISNDYKTVRSCTNNYDYYENSNFEMTYDEIDECANNFAINDTVTGDLLTTGFSYSKKFNPYGTYQKYNETAEDYGVLQSFLLNSVFYAKHITSSKNSERAMFEFKFYWSENGQSSSLLYSEIVRDLPGIFEKAATLYGLDISLVKDPNNSVYAVVDDVFDTTTIIFTVAKNA